MRVLIAGAPGAIGRPLVKALQAKRYDVTAIMRSPLGEGPALDVVPVVADVLDRDGLLSAVDGLRADVVIHLFGALPDVPARFEDVETVNELRVVGTRNLIEAARAIGARRFITQSTVAGYGFAHRGSRLVTEADPFGRRHSGRAASTVAAMYAAEEQVLEATDIDGIALRYGNLYGPGATESMLDVMRSGQLAVPKDGGGTTSWIHVEDAAAATLAALELGSGGEAYNIVDDTPTTWGEMFDELSRVSHVAAPRHLPAWLIKRQAPYLATLMIGNPMPVSNAKARQTLGWVPSYPSTREGLTHMEIPTHGSVIERF